MEYKPPLTLKAPELTFLLRSLEPWVKPWIMLHMDPLKCQWWPNSFTLMYSIVYRIVLNYINVIIFTIFKVLISWHDRFKNMPNKWSKKAVFSTKDCFLASQTLTLFLLFWPNQMSGLDITARIMLVKTLRVGVWLYPC